MRSGRIDGALQGGETRGGVEDGLLLIERDYIISMRPAMSCALLLTSTHTHTVRSPSIEPLSPYNRRLAFSLDPTHAIILTCSISATSEDTIALQAPLLYYKGAHLSRFQKAFARKSRLLIEREDHIEAALTSTT